MTMKKAVRLVDKNLVVKDQTILTSVPENIVATSGGAAGPVDGLFLGAVFDQEASNHVASLGTLRNVRFLACFRFQLWWMTQKTGDKGSEIPLETQFMLLKTEHESDSKSDNNEVVYTVILPIIEGHFKACLQGNENDEVELCLESGDNETVRSAFGHSVYISAGTDPFEMIHEAIRAVKSHLGTFRLRQEKKLPGIVDFFGWCTWDAFYRDVNQEGVEAGLHSLSAGGTPPKFVIIDDGWQSVAYDDDKQPEIPDYYVPVMRLTGIKENEKFRKEDDPTTGIKNVIDMAKKKYGLKYVYVWHTIVGYWAGVRPEMEEYGSFIQYPKLSKGVMENEPVWKKKGIIDEGLGLVNPKNVFKFYDDMHSYLASAGIDGIKVDEQCILETLGANLGGRVELTRQYHQALDASVSKNFPDNGCIACMCHNIDSFYCSKQTSIVRASDDFFPKRPVSHTIHIAAVSYNSLFLGEFMLTDWDMFHSLHPAAEYHGSARAISGGPVYVSDKPGKHNFDLLKKLVLPDGSTLRAQLPGRPTKDCLFSDPTRDGVSLLKIWNLNKYTGVLGVYNCQGAAWNSVEKQNTFHQTTSEAITSYFRGDDVHLISQVALDSNWNGNCAVYSFRNGDLITLSHNVAMPVSLKILEHEIYTIAPIQVLAPGFGFAPLGLIEMFNSGGAIEGLSYEVKTGSLLSDGTVEQRVENLSLESVALVSLKVKGCGRFGAYSSAKPKACKVGSSMVDFAYELSSGLLTLNLKDMPPEDQKFHIVEIEL